MKVKNRFTCSDIHGCFETFRRAFETVINPGNQDELYLLGDYINKGPASKQMLDYLVDLKADMPTLHILMGNHEQLLLDSFQNVEIEKNWINKGGDTTLLSFGIDSIYDIPEKYINFIKTFDYYHELEDCFLVHAGFNFTLENPFLGKDDMVTIREYAVDRQIIGSKVIVHGHVPKTLAEIEASIKTGNQKIGIDAGCVYKDKGMGNLAILELNSRELFLQKNIDN